MKASELCKQTQGRHSTGQWREEMNTYSRNLPKSVVILHKVCERGCYWAINKIVE